MKTTYGLYAALAVVTGLGEVSAAGPQPVGSYVTSGREIIYIPTAAPPAPSSTSAPSSAAQQSSTVAPISHTAVAVLTSALSSESAEANTQPSATIQAAAVTAAPVVDVAGAGVMTIDITNNWPSPLSISYLNNAGSPSAIGAPQGAPLGTKTSVIYPTGWAGRIYVGKTINSADSKIEGSTTGANDIDVSYVDGFSVPITCSVGNTPVTGCNINLWAVSGTCASPAGGDQNVCLNPMQDHANGPSDPWFLPCQGAAYTFPNDNIANDGDTRSPNLTCCIGTAEQGCAAPERQGKGNNQPSKAKRSLAEDMRAGAPSLLPLKHSHLRRHLLKAGSHGAGTV